MLAAQPPRRTSRSSTRNDSAILSSWSTTSESANRPGKVMRWSVAIEPVMTSDTAGSWCVRTARRLVGDGWEEYSLPAWVPGRAHRGSRRTGALLNRWSRVPTRHSPPPDARGCEVPAAWPAQLFDRSLVERVAAGAGAGGVGVVDREALLLDRVDEVDDGAVEVGHAHPVDHDLDAVEVGHGVAIEVPLVEEQLVAEAGAATRLHRDAQLQVVSALLVEEAPHLAGGGGRQVDAVRADLGV